MSFMHRRAAILLNVVELCLASKIVWKPNDQHCQDTASPQFCEVQIPRLSPSCSYPSVEGCVSFGQESLVASHGCCDDAWIQERCRASCGWCGDGYRSLGLNGGIGCGAKVDKAVRDERGRVLGTPRIAQTPDPEQLAQKKKELHDKQDMRQQEQKEQEKRQAAAKLHAAEIAWKAQAKARQPQALTGGGGGMQAASAYQQGESSSGWYPRVLVSCLVMGAIALVWQQETASALDKIMGIMHLLGGGLTRLYGAIQGTQSPGSAPIPTPSPLRPSQPEPPISRLPTKFLNRLPKVFPKFSSPPVLICLSSAASFCPARCALLLLFRDDADCLQQALEHAAQLLSTHRHCRAAAALSASVISFFSFFRVVD